MARLASCQPQVLPPIFEGPIGMRRQRSCGSVSVCGTSCLMPVSGLALSLCDLCLGHDGTPLTAKEQVLAH
jgi:hypothetical protein